MGGTGIGGLMASECRRELELAEGKADQISLVRIQSGRRELTIRSTGPHPAIVGDIPAKFPNDLTHPDPTVFLYPALLTYCGRLEAHGLWRWSLRVDRHQDELCSLDSREISDWIPCANILGEKCRELFFGLTDRGQRPARWTWRNTAEPRRQRASGTGERAPYWRIANEG